MRSMSRGKQQVLYNYLPGRTFDFENVPVIARVDTIRGAPVNDLSMSIVLLKVADEARAWRADLRPVLRDDVLQDNSRFVLVDPEEVRAQIFPLVFWCQNRSCGRVWDRTGQGIPTSVRCPSCRTGKLLQLRFVRVRRCGALAPLKPPPCRQCGTTQQIALDTRGSERIADFRRVCRTCNTAQTVFGGRCLQCQWQGDTTLQNMDVEVHRAGRTYYAHSIVVLNAPGRELSMFLSLDGWEVVAAAKQLGLPEVANRPLSSFVPTAPQSRLSDATLSGADLDELLSKQASGELTPDQLAAQLADLLNRRRREQTSSSPAGIAQVLMQRTGTNLPVWEEAGQEMLEAVLPFEIATPTDLASPSVSDAARDRARQMKLESVLLFSDFPIVTATYGYSRVGYAPGECRLNAFPADQNFGGRLPIYVDRIQADALSLRLDPSAVVRWMRHNNMNPVLPSGSDPDLSVRAYFVRLFAGTNLRETIQDNREVRMVFGLLHTLAHLSVRQAALLCGLEMMSISEYILPRALTFSIYCNHRFGATIGALTALFEQSLADWLQSVWSSTRCIYDPVCREREGACHACLYLSETSCRFFNLNLNRAFLFGGADPVLQGTVRGFFEDLVS